MQFYGSDVERAHLGGAFRVRIGSEKGNSSLAGSISSRLAKR
jgi:hypothetical protein